jgi:hypothetical protein
MQRWRRSCANCRDSHPYQEEHQCLGYGEECFGGGIECCVTAVDRSDNESNAILIAHGLSTWGEEKSRISSLSPTGCYIDSRFTTPAEGTVVQDITITLATGSLTLQGTVIDTMRGIGFAVRFTELDKHTRDTLSVLIRDLQTTVEDRIGGCSTPAGR